MHKIPKTSPSSPMSSKFVKYLLAFFDLPDRPHLHFASRKAVVCVSPKVLIIMETIISLAMPSMKPNSFYLQTSEFLRKVSQKNAEYIIDYIAVARWNPNIDNI